MPVKAKIQQQLQTLGEDNVSGAREIADLAAQLLFDLLRSEKKISREKLLSEVGSISNSLLDMQPSIGPLYNLTNGLLLLLEKKDPNFHPLEAGKEWLALFRRRLFRNGEKLREFALDLIPDRGAVATYSFSSTVVETLIAAKKKKKNFEVWCSESRPNLEGRRLANQLADAGISVRFGVDAALLGWVRDAQIFLIGGDAISTQGLLNKLGTESLALSAKDAGVAVYSLADTEKIIPSALGKRLHIPSRDAVEVWGTTKAAVEVENRYFSWTPLDRIDGVVTETGLCRAEALLKISDEAPVSKILAASKGKKRKISGSQRGQGERISLVL